MTDEEIDIVWQQALQDSVKAGEPLTRYRFAKMVEDAAFKRWAAQTKAAVDAEREACAKVCDDKQYVHPSRDLGSLIRARGNK